MIKRFPAKTICVIVLFIFVMWLWQVSFHNENSSDVSLASKIAAVSDVQAAPSDAAESAVLVVNNELDVQLAKRLKATSRLIDNNQVDEAVSELNAIIKAQPQAVEPYINLAAIHAKSKNIDLARKTLLDGINVNKNTAVLFESLQKVYAAQAALAYQRALEIDTVDDASLVVHLPKINTLSLSRSSESDAALQAGNRKQALRITELENERANLLANVETLRQEKQSLASENTRLKDVSNSQSSGELQQLKSDKERLLAQVSSVGSEQAKLTQKNEELTSENTKLLALNRDFENKIKRQLLISESNLQAQEALQNELSSLKAQLAQSNSVASIETQEPVVVTIEPKLSQETLNKTAVALVQKWASAWSAQNVPAYVARYADDFRPSSGLSHQQWLAQRQVRLTNKSFIDVKVSKFKVDDQGGTFSVTFSQHYRSNNVDDRIVKQLVFLKKGDDWSDAKIVAEKITGR